ncbi:MarC family protein [Caulobacter sp. 17J80-11]|uniref:MarC family protein n=1 Tax=Caulobacter sp. 17J80-11 TaxID=2763502 RepID=UPI0016537268|nr:MarC family protein [Caulobacter sp. 17J80-11]MBC6983581.1 MarC family protein [Caulobacter sp. 17J80-11]
MSLAALAVNFFVALFALIDPVGNVPIYAAATSGASSAQRRRLALYLSLFIIAFLTFFFFTGLALLQFFGISIAAFRIAGGILLFLLGLEMAREDFIAVFADSETGDPAHEVSEYARKRFERLIVPFGMPLLIGPGVISAVIIQASEVKKFGLNGVLAGLGVILAVGVATFASFALTGPISRVLGKIGMAIVVRVLGLILCALAVQFIIAGLGEATHGFITKSVATPYAH